MSKHESLRVIEGDPMKLDGTVSKDNALRDTLCCAALFGLLVLALIKG